MHKKFQMGEHVYLYNRPRKISLKVGYCAKLAPRFCGPFQLLERVGIVAYRLALPTTLKSNDISQISLLKRYVHGTNHVFDWFVI